MWHTHAPFHEFTGFVELCDFSSPAAWMKSVNPRFTDSQAKCAIYGFVEESFARAASSFLALKCASADLTMGRMGRCSRQYDMKAEMEVSCCAAQMRTRRCAS